MKLVASIKLLPTDEQADALKATLERCNEACNWLVARAIETDAVRPFDLQRVAYREVRDQFGLAAQVAIRCIAKVAAALKAKRRGARPTFRSFAAQPFDDRIFRMAGNTVSIWTIAGRVKIKIAAGDVQRDLLATRKGEVDLAFVKGKWLLHCACDVDEAEAQPVASWLGVDLGLANVATTSDGTIIAGDRVMRARDRYSRIRAYHQSKAADAARRSARRSHRRKLQKIAGQESRFRRQANHEISKAIVADAERTGRGIALENLTHIRARAKANGRKQRARLHGWSFSQLREFITYKAALSGVPVVAVNPAYTSQACSCCGCIDKRNRPSQSAFSCVECGHRDHADINAARNISTLARAAVTRLEKSQVVAA